MDRMQPQNLTAATYTLTSEGNSGTTLTLSRAAGITCTLPASVGDGSTFEFFVNTTVTSNSDIIKVANSTDVMAGVAVVATDNASDVVVAFETAATSDTITLNGTTTGGIKGDRIILKDVAAGFWFVNIIMSGTGTEATPFSATV
jgi:hypothetical protein